MNRQNYVLFPVVGLALAGLAACGAKGSDAMRAYVETVEGDWGWSNGRGCADRVDVWAIEGTMIEVYREGRLVNRFQIESRAALRANGMVHGSGPIEQARWTMIGRDPENPDRLGRHHIRFDIRGGIGRPTALQPRLKRSFTDARTREGRRIDDPRGGDRLVSCAEVSPNA